jgi:hypothetical protein
MFASRMISRLCTVRALLFTILSSILAVSLSAASVERTGSLSASAASAEVRQAIDPKGYRVTLDDGWTADFWFARALPTTDTNKDAAGALYPVLSNGEFAGVVTFPKGASDYRGQSVPAGTYTLRYQYMPQDANHMGVSPNPDFLLAIPIASDTTPLDNMPFKRLVTLSATTTGTPHPAVFAMAPAATDGVTKDDQGMTIFAVEIPTSAGKGEKIAIIVKGQASQ